MINFGGSESTLSKLKLKDNKKLKCLIFDKTMDQGKINISSLKLNENKELEYIDVAHIKINYLDLKENKKITVQRKNDFSRFRQNG